MSTRQPMAIDIVVSADNGLLSIDLLLKRNSDGSCETTNLLTSSTTINPTWTLVISESELREAARTERVSQLSRIVSESFRQSERSSLSAWEAWIHQRRTKGFKLVRKREGKLALDALTD
jgi:hypothetical protein